MKRDLWQAKHKCTKCSLTMKKKKLIVEDVAVRALECIKCKETVLHPEDAQKMLVYNKLKKGISVKIGQLGRSLIIRFPKEVEKFYNIKKGKEAVLKAEDLNKLEFDLTH